ncbi:Gfo/Idh/MocA family protein [Gulosibacter chungangensis]|uniref:Gfo/Idh/MocA family oxidoreductase n=1 Tax=Gulosibacter chungangensis TaxID=979746 RepID=A0A7J5BCM9_9MICO|nr:Gfo/Idh/MocA family oxidoreductase [Gulosibacter chungangensis]KAB1642701.1 Gfo/Idh/MocA family oxidoreductase [Gulosibacter chungangensis]
MTKEFRVALVGAGYAGQAHAFGYRNAQMADNLSGLRVVLDTVVDPNVELATQVAERYGFERTAADIDEVLKNPAIDAVSVALPNFVYREVLAKALRAGKHVFAEKPLGTSAAEAKELAEIAAESDRVAAVGFSFRRVPAVAAARQAVQQGKIGAAYFARGFYYADYALDPKSPRTWRFSQEKSGGGALIDIGAHVIDLMVHLLGPVKAVLSSSLTTLISERPLPAGGIGHQAKASETETAPVTNDDVALLTLEFESGAVASVQLSRVSAGTPNQLGFEVFGSDGHVSFDSTKSDEYSIFELGKSAAGADGPQRVISGPDMPYYADVSPMRARGTGTGYGEAFIAEIQEFIAAAVNEEAIETTFAATVHPMLVIQAALDSAQSQKPVEIRA